jgi:CO/xanthine dehydrogenase Mo-binding subunit
MNTTRREFLKAGTLFATGLALELGVDGRLRRVGEALAAEPEAGAAFRPSAWLTIEPGGRTVITVGRVEMGQGVRTSLPMIVADELDADWSRVEVETAMPGPDFQRMTTSGSWSIGGSYEPLRRMGARARAMLVAAAAARWGVDASTCRTESGRVLHPGSKRSLGYGELAPDAAKLPVPADAPLKPASEYRLMGRRTPRRDARAIVTGAARYGMDLRVPGMKFATIERRPVAGARLGSLDDSAARRVPGVRDVVRLSNGVAVVADHTWAALEGRRALRLTWEGGDEPRFDSAGYQARLLEATKGSGSVGRAVNDAQKALAGASRRLDAVYEYPFFVHAPLEPMNTVAHVHDGRCELWASTQAPNPVQAAVAKQLGLAQEKVEVHVPLLGGGFGRRLGVDYALEAAELSRAIRTPVQVMWTREDDMCHGFFQPAATHRMAAGLDAAGRIVAWWHREASSAQNYRDRMDPANPDLAAIHMWGGVDNPYVYGAMRAEFMLVEAPIPLGPWRAVFAPSNVMARECFVDEIATAVGKDPVALRLALLEERDGAEDAIQSQRRRLAAVIRLAAGKSGWGSPLPRGRGRGIAAHVYDGETTLAQVAEVSVEGGTPRVHRFVCAIDCGPVVNPLGLEAVVESGVVWGLSQTLGREITFRDGRAEQSNYADYPILTLSQTPAIETHFIEGAKQPLGAGEQPVAPVAAAVLNALFAATGKRVRRVPVGADAG